MSTEELTPGLRQAAVTLLGLGKELAAQVLAQMNDDEAAQLTRALLRVGPVPADEIRGSLMELAAGMGRISDVSAPQTSWVTEVLTEGLGPERANALIADATRPDPFAWMVTTDHDTLATVLESESPATVAIVLSNIDPTLGGKLLRKLPRATQLSVAGRVAQLEVVPERTLRSIDDALLEQVGKVVTTPTRHVDGVTCLADLLGRVPRRESDAVLADMRSYDPRRASKVADQMFTFADVLDLERRYLQKVLAAVDVRTLAVAIHGATTEEIETVFANMPERAAANLREEVDFLGPVRAADVRTARKEVIAIVGSLEAEGEIVRDSGTDDTDDEWNDTPADEETQQ